MTGNRLQPPVTVTQAAGEWAPDAFSTSASNGTSTGRRLGFPPASPIRCRGRDHGVDAGNATDLGRLTARPGALLVRAPTVWRSSAVRPGRHWRIRPRDRPPARCRPRRGYPVNITTGSITAPTIRPRPPSRATAVTAGISPSRSSSGRTSSGGRSVVPTRAPARPTAPAAAPTGWARPSGRWATCSACRNGPTSTPRCSRLPTSARDHASFPPAATAGQSTRAGILHAA
jgi:hypothetical protein